MNIDPYLNKIMNETEFEKVIKAITDAADALNTDELIDIVTEKLMLNTAIIGKNIRKIIARILYMLSRYTPNKKILIVTQDEYDNLVDVNDNVLYVIRKDSKCFTSTIDKDGYLDLFKSGVHLFDEHWWTETIAYTMVAQVVENNHGFGDIELFVGKDFNIDEFLPEQFSGEKCNNLKKVQIDLPSYIVGIRSFADCRDLRYINLGSGVTFISIDAFSGCHDLTIVIDKPEGSIVGAPWGAHNATIIWGE